MYSSFPGAVFKLKGTILRLAFLAADGSLLPAPAEAWWDAKGSEEKEATSYAKRKGTSLATSPSNQELPAGTARLQHYKMASTSLLVRCYLFIANT